MVSTAAVDRDIGHFAIRRRNYLVWVRPHGSTRDDLQCSRIHNGERMVAFRERQQRLLRRVRLRSTSERYTKQNTQHSSVSTHLPIPFLLLFVQDIPKDSRAPWSRTNGQPSRLGFLPQRCHQRIGVKEHVQVTLKRALLAFR